jgi:glutathione synthase
VKICFLMYPWDRVEAETDTTLRLIHEAVRRGHTVARLTPSALTMRDTEVYGFCNVFRKGKVPGRIPAFYKQAQFKKVKLPMGGFDCIFMRSNPPLDALALNFLDSVKSDVFIVNDLDGLRVANNKIYTATFTGPASRYIPSTYVSKNKEYLESVLEESETDRMVLKPLDGYGGRGVIVLEKDARQNTRSLLDYYIGEGDKSHYVILQEFVEGAENGDVRILMLNGQPIGAMRRVPGKGELRSNIHVGGKAVKHSLSRDERALCSAVGPYLVRDGLYFVGLDVIAGKLIEVNVLSPGGITRINKLNRARLQAEVIDFVETVVESREFHVQRRVGFRQVIDEAGES